MPSDYDQIRAENLQEYGHGTRHLAFLGTLYPDRTHFLFELLQNAEDGVAPFGWTVKDYATNPSTVHLLSYASGDK